MVKMVMRHITITLAVVALFLGVPARAQQNGAAQPTQFPPTRSAEAIAPGSPAGMVPAAPPLVHPQPGDVANDVWGPDKPMTPAVPAPGGGLYSIGPCDEVTGHGYCCPTDWYLDQRVRVMYHPKVRSIALGAVRRRGDIAAGRSQHRKHCLREHHGSSERADVANGDFGSGRRLRRHVRALSGTRLGQSRPLFGVLVLRGKRVARDRGPAYAGHHYRDQHGHDLSQQRPTSQQYRGHVRQPLHVHSVPT